MDARVVAPVWPRPGAVAMRAWVAAAAAGYCFLVAHLAFGLGGHGFDHLADRWVYDTLEVVAAAGCLLRAATKRDERLPWAVLGIGILAFATGDLCFDFVYAGSPPPVSICDAFYLAFYPCCYAALALLVRARISRFDRSVWLDGVIAALATCAVSASIVLEVVLHATHGSQTTVIVDLAYPAADLVLLGIVVFAFAVTGRHPGRAWVAAGAAFGVITLADSLFLYLNATGGYTEGTMLDALWPGAMLLLALAAWQPAERVYAVPLEGRFFATPLLCGTAAVAVFAYGRFHAVNPVAFALAAATVVAVFVRAGMSLGDHARLLEGARTQSLTDELTGLGNRRNLFLTLQRELGREQAKPMVFAIYDLNGFKRYNDTFGHPSGDALLVRLAARLAQAVGPDGHAFRLGGDEFCLLVPCQREAMPAVVEAGLAALSEEGEGFRVGAELGSVVLPDEAFDATTALRLADERLYAQKYSLYQGDGEAYELLLRVLDERDPALRRRMRVVTELAVAIGGQLGLAGQSLERLRLAAEVHDIGKLALPVALLDKEEPFDEVDWDLVRQHPVVGQRMLSGIASMREVGQIVRATHERWDGCGYVDGLAGTAIPLAARIIAVCDAYAAMTSDRPFRRALPPLQAVAELRRCAGTQFDPQVVVAFCRLHDDIARPPASELTAVP